MWALCYQPRGKNFATRENFIFFFFMKKNFRVRVCFWYKYLIQVQSCTNTAKDVEGTGGWAISILSASLSANPTLEPNRLFPEHRPQIPTPPRLCSACSLHLGYPVPSLPVESLLLLQDPSGFSLILVLFLLSFSYMYSWHFFFTEGGLCELWYHFFPHPWAHSRSSAASCTDKMLTW